MNETNLPQDFQNCRKKEMKSIVEKKEMMIEKRGLGELQEKSRDTTVAPFRPARNHMAPRVL